MHGNGNPQRPSKVARKQQRAGTGVQHVESWAYGTHRVTVARIAAATLGGKR